MAVDQVGATLMDLLDPDVSFSAVVGRIAAAVTDRIAGAGSCGITWLSPTGMPLTIASDVCAAELEQHQRQTGSGPCVRALDHGDLAVGWVTLPGDADRMCLAVPLRIAGRLDGVISWYSTSTGVFPDSAWQVAAECAGQVVETLEVAQTMALTQSRGHLNLHDALENRSMIDLAKGILMGWRRYGPDQAFDELRSVSRRTNISVGDLAAQLIEAVHTPNAVTESDHTPNAELLTTYFPPPKP